MIPLVSAFMRSAFSLTGVIVLVLICGGIALYVAAERMEPPSNEVEIMIPDETFPR